MTDAATHRASQVARVRAITADSAAHDARRTADVALDLVPEANADQVV